MFIDNCGSNEHGTTFFIDTKSAGRNHKLLPTRLTSKREVHLPMMGEPIDRGLCGGTHSYAARRNRVRKANAIRH